MNKSDLPSRQGNDCGGPPSAYGRWRRRADGQGLRPRIGKKVRSLLPEHVADANGLLDTPRFYNSLTTNCTTTIVKMARAVQLRAYAVGNGRVSLPFNPGEAARPREWRRRGTRSSGRRGGGR